MRAIIAILLLFSSLSLGLGISLPIVRFEKLYFFEETPSILSLISGLWSEASYVIALAVLLFSVIFPIVKLGLAFIEAMVPDAKGLFAPARWASVLAKWSMMDVLLVALVIFAAKTSGLANAFTQTGLWFYAASAIAGATATGLLKRQQMNEKNAGPSDQEGRLVPGLKD